MPLASTNPRKSYIVSTVVSIVVLTHNIDDFNIKEINQLNGLSHFESSQRSRYILKNKGHNQGHDFDAE